MLNINITVRDVALNISRDFTIAVDEQAPTQELITLLTKKLGWPEKDIDGNVVSYGLFVERGARKTRHNGRETITSVGLLNGDILTLGPELSGGGRTAIADNRFQSVDTGGAPYRMTPLKTET